MKNPQKILQALLSCLEELRIRYYWISDDGMKDKAVAAFSLDLHGHPCILCGTFSDPTREIISIVHEAGHVMIYRELDREESRAYICSIFAAQGIGINRISPDGQECILMIEARASVKGLDLLNRMALSDEELEIVKRSLSKWYTSYEKHCHEEVVRKVRERIMKNGDALFLISHC